VCRAVEVCPTYEDNNFQFDETDIQKLSLNENLKSSFNSGKLSLSDNLKESEFYLNTTVQYKLSPPPIFYEINSSFVVRASVAEAQQFLQNFFDESEVDLTKPKQSDLLKYKGMAYENHEPIQFVLWCYTPTPDILAKHGAPSSSSDCFLLEFQRMSGCCMATMEFKKRLFSEMKGKFEIYSQNKSLDSPPMKFFENAFPDCVEMLASDLTSFLTSEYHENIIDGLSLIARISSQSNLKVPDQDAEELLTHLVPLISSASTVISNLAATALSLLVRSSGLDARNFLLSVQKARLQTNSNCAIRHIDEVLAMY